MEFYQAFFVSIRISITRAIGRKRHVFLVEFGLSTICRIVFIISSQSLQPREETITKTAFDHNKIIELNFRLICKLQQNRCQSSKNSTISQGILQFCCCCRCCFCLQLFFPKFFLFFLCAASFRMRPVIHLCSCCFWPFANLCAIVDVLIIQTFNNIYQF